MRVNWPGRHTTAVIENEPVVLDVQRMADGTIGRARPLHFGDDLGAGKVGAELIGDELGGARPVIAHREREAHAGRELLELGAS
jgi:hypothetical protein